MIILDKGFFALVLFAAVVVGAYAAWIVRSGAEKTLIAAAESFAAGSIFCAGFLHLLADAVESFDENEDIEKDTSGSRRLHTGEAYPWPFLLCALGCIMTHGLEAGAAKLWRLSAGSNDEKSKHRDPEPGIVGVDRAEVEGGGEDWEEEQDQLIPVDGAFEAKKIPGKVVAHMIINDLDSNASSLSGLLLMLALSIHSILEGLSLGAASKSHAWGIFLAIFAHKGVAAFALGVSWLRLGTKGQQGSYVAAMSWFASMTPLGIVVGKSAEESPAASAVTALSAGTFIYIGLVEGSPGVQKPWLPGTGALVQAAGYVCGFSAMAILAAWT